MNRFKLVAEVGFPIAAACAGGYFVFLTDEVHPSRCYEFRQRTFWYNHSFGQSCQNYEPRCYPY
jgi:hypothetical protein